MSMKPTLKELASTTGMSIATVSRALSQPEKVKYSTRMKVEAAKREFQQQNINKRSGIIGMIVPDLSNQFFPLMLEGVGSISSEYGTTIMLCNSNGSTKDEENALRKLLDIKADGIIYITTGEPSALLREIVANEIVPVIFLDRNPGLKRLNLITTDNKNGMFQATRYLVTLGHRRIIYLGGKEETSTDKDRLQGFKEAIKESGIDENQCKETHADYSYQKAFDIISSMISNHNISYTAIAAANDTMAMGAMKALRTAGLKVPEDISIIGYDDIPSAAFNDLTTVRQPFEEMGRTAIMQLMAAIADFSAPKKITVLPSSIVFRNSCAVPKAMLPL